MLSEAETAELPPAPRIPDLKPDHGNGLRVAVGTEITITSENATTIRYTLDNTEPTCSSGLVYSAGAKPKIMTTNTTVKAIGCNAAGSSGVTPRWYFTSTPRSSLFDFDAVRAGVGHDGGGFDVRSYAVPTPAGAIFVGGKAELNAAVAGAVDGQTIVVRDGRYDLGLVDFRRATSAANVTIRAQNPGCHDGVRGVTLNGTTRFRFWTDRWKLEGFCFDGIFNPNPAESSTPFSNAVTIMASDVTVSQNVFQNIGDEDNWAIVVKIGGGTNPQAERKTIVRDVVTRNLFTRIQGFGMDLPQPSSVDTSPYIWATYPEITDNTFDTQPAYKTKDSAWGKAIHLGTGWDFAESFNDNQYALIARNYFNRWDGGSAELICIKSSGNIIEDNLINESYGGFSIRRGNNNVVQRNFVINNNPSCLATRTSGYGNIIQENAFDLHPYCIAWGLTVKTPETGGYPGMTVSTYPAKKNYFRWNKVKNAKWVMWIMNKGADQSWMHQPLLTEDLPTDNQLRLNEFHQMGDSVLFHSDLSSGSGVDENALRSLNTVGTDNTFAP